MRTDWSWQKILKFVFPVWLTALALVFILESYIPHLFSKAVANQKNWDPIGYLQASKWQKKSAQDIVNNYNFKGDETILDVCCGEGKITSYMGTKVPRGEVLGIDISPEMIRCAQQLHSKDNVQFQLGDACSMHFDQHFDLATSFTGMHLVRNQLNALRSMHRSLKEGGKVLMQFPVASGFGTSLEEVISSEKWKSYFAHFSPGWHFFTPEDYRTLLQQTGLHPLRVEITELDEIYPSVKDFKKSISYWLPYSKSLPDELQNEFLNDLLDKYVAQYPLDDQGSLHYVIQRLEVEAIKLP